MELVISLVIVVQPPFCGEQSLFTGLTAMTTGLRFRVVKSYTNDVLSIGDVVPE